MVSGFLFQDIWDHETLLGDRLCGHMVLGQAYGLAYQVVDFVPTSVFKFYITVSAWGSMVLKAAEKSEQAPGGSGEGSSIVAMEPGLGGEEPWGCCLGSLNRGLKSSLGL